MNALELADKLLENNAVSWGDCTYEQHDNDKHFKTEASAMLRQQQAEMEELEKENTDLRYLIATKLEQQDGISLNSMAHPITNTPEPGYEIDPDKLETIEIDLPSPKPVAWWARDRNTGIGYVQISKPTRMDKVANEYIPLYASRQDLTDEEIEQVWTEVTCQELNVPYTFARAILRKAQE